MYNNIFITFIMSNTLIFGQYKIPKLYALYLIVNFEYNLLNNLKIYIFYKHKKFKMSVIFNNYAVYLSTIFKM